MLIIIIINVKKPMATSVCVSALFDSDCDGTAGCSADLATDAVAAAAATGIARGRPYIAGRLPIFRRWCRPSWAAGAAASNSCSPAWSFEGLCRIGTGGGPWCREALDGADGESSFQWRTGLGRCGMAADGSRGVAAPNNRAISQLDWTTNKIRSKCYKNWDGSKAEMAHVHRCL